MAKGTRDSRGWSEVVETRLRARPTPVNQTDEDRYYDGVPASDVPALDHEREREPWDNDDPGELDAEHWKKGKR